MKTYTVKGWRKTADGGLYQAFALVKANDIGGALTEAQNRIGLDGGKFIERVITSIEEV